MTAKIAPTGWQVNMMLPARGRWQQFRLKAADTYTCAGCDVLKTTQFVAVADLDWSAPTCTECYQLAEPTFGPEDAAGNRESPAAIEPTPFQRIDLQRPGSALRQVAEILIARAAGREITADQEAAVAELSVSDGHPVALRYAHALLDRKATAGDDYAGADRDLARRLLDRELQAVLSRRRQRLDEERAALGSVKRVQDPLPALLLWKMRTSKFDEALGIVMAEQGFTRSSLDLPAETLWDWLNVLRGTVSVGIPAEVHDLRKQSYKALTQYLLKLSHEAEPALTALSHPAAVERWSRSARGAVQSLGAERRRLVKKFAIARERDKLPHAMATADAAYALACAMETTATLLQQDLQQQVYKMFQQSATREVRASRLLQAANMVARGEPRLAPPIRDICAAHTASCPVAARGDSCVACAPVMVARVQALLSGPPRPTVAVPPQRLAKTAVQPAAKSVANPPAPRLMAPGQTIDVRWMPTGDRIRAGAVKAMWQVAVTRDAMARGRCPLPDGTVLPPDETRRLRLRFEHTDADVAPQTVTLRCVAGMWELGNVRWPSSLLPGVLVVFSWRTDRALVTATTRQLRRPERIDGTEFRHEFDRQVVTRELVPGGRWSGNLSVENWVLRTLRVLGHLCPQGTATLAEEALVRNCRSLGMPSALAKEVPKATSALVKAGRIRRVRGGQDAYGELWYPARHGDTVTDLLRYEPTVQILKPQSFARMSTAAERSAHQVHGFVRRLPAGAHASEKQLELHREAVIAAEVANRSLDPDRFTFVAKFGRGATRRGR